MASQSLIQSRLNKWPHLLRGCGGDAHLMLRGFSAGRPISITELRKTFRSSPLGQLVKHGLVTLADPGKDPTYQITERGIVYLNLLITDNLFPTT